MTWIELTAHTTDEAIDWIRTLLASTNYQYNIFIKSFINSQNNFSTDIEEMTWTNTVQIYLEQNDQTLAHVDQIIQILSSLQRTAMMTELEVSTVEELPSLSESCSAKRVGRFVITSPYSSYRPATNETPLIIESRFGFGSGFHPATILSLQLLERYIAPGMNTLDLGSGSGILSVAMAKLGATVTAIDNDPIAVQATEGTIKINQVDHAVTVRIGSLGSGSSLGHWMGGTAITGEASLQPEGDFDLIVANLFARIHISLVNDYRKALQHNSDRSSLIITAGYDIDYEQEIDLTFTQAGFRRCDRAQYGDWVALVHECNSDR